MTEQRRSNCLYHLGHSTSPSNVGSPSPVTSSVPSPGDSPSPVPSPVPSPGGSSSAEPSSVPSPVPSSDPFASATDSSDDESAQSTFSSSSTQRNGPRKRIAIRKLKKARRLKLSRRPQTKLLYNHYVGPGDGWTILGSSDPPKNPLDASLPSPSSIPIHHLKVPPSYDVLGSQDPFDFLDPEASVATAESSSSCVSPVDDDDSSVSTVQHANTASTPPIHTPVETPPFSLPGFGRVNAKFDVSMHPRLSAVLQPPEYSHKRTIMINACSISHNFRKNFDYQPNTIFRALLDTGAWGSATCHKEIIHDYTKYSARFPCPVRLSGAITNDGGTSTSIVPLGEGYIHVPSSFPRRGVVRVKVYYSPHLTGTIINEEDLMGSTKKQRKQYSGLNLHKSYGIEDDDINTWELKVQHKSNDNTRDIIITGIQNDAGKCYTQPLLFPRDVRLKSPLATIHTNIDMAMVGDAEFRKD